MTPKTIIYTECLNDAQRVSAPAKLFGAAGFALKLEPMIFSMARMLSDDYQGGYWEMFSLSNGGFFMAPSTEHTLITTSPNGYTGTMSAAALGISASLFTYSHLSFGDGPLAEACAEHYHLLREYALDHPEAKAIMGCID